MTILPATYLGGTDYFSHLTTGAIIDAGERWVKQTTRNRCEILTSHGSAALTVPVHSARSTRDVRIDDSKRWRHVHWQSLVSAYGGAPFFEHYRDQFAPVFVDRQHEFLLDLDLELLEIVLGILRLPMPHVSTGYVDASPGDLDLRGKKALRRKQSAGEDSNFRSSQSSRSERARSEHSGVGKKIESDESIERHYTQVFFDRMPFQSGLSIVDLIFCEGPDATDFL